MKAKRLSEYSAAQLAAAMKSARQREKIEPMSPEAYKRAIAKLGLSQVRAGKLLGVTARTGQAWALGERKIPRSAELLVKLLARGTITIDDLKM